MTQPIISFRDFSFQYNAQKSPTLNKIDLDIYPGQKVLIAGPSGSGKSTLGNCINGLIPASYPGTVTGSLTVAGLDAPKAGIFALSKHVGTVLQDPDGQFIALTVGEDIAFSLENDCVPQAEMRDTVRRFAETVRVNKLLEMAPHELSGGQKQRVGLAGVMVNRADILLFDEPLANLDPRTGKETIELIDEITRSEEKTVIIIEHRLEDVLWRRVDRVILMDDGAIVADVTPDELLMKDLLRPHGIREPLYVTALRYAGVPLTAAMHPADLHSLSLTEENKAAVRRWFEQFPAPAPAAEAPVALEVRDLHFGYAADEILHGIAFSIRKGECVSIVGMNGAGKSTLAKLICGFESPQSGSVRLEGRDVTGDTIRQRAARIGYVMQDPNRMISRTMIREEVALGLQNRGLTEEEIRSRVEETLKICGLYPFRNWPISALSFGQKKRVTIASVLVMGPEIIILDEPTAGQDFRHYTEIMEFLHTLTERGITVLMITHDMHLMLEYTSRGIVLAEGRILADTSSAAILCDPALTDAAYLKQTSLFALAEACGISDPIRFVKCFIHRDREVRS